MPMQPPRACQGNGPHSNPQGTTLQGYYCDACRAKQQEGRKDYDQERSHKAHRKLYQSAAWKRLRLYKLSQNPLCELCEKMEPPRYTPAEVVHHLKDHNGDPLLFYSYQNLQSLDAVCHNKLTGFSHGFGSDNSDEAPNTIPVAFEHKDLPDGYEGLKEKYNRWYRKNGVNWVLLPKDHKPLDKQI
jgi:5-methylcytosine-specific restriction protein A